MAGPWEKYQAAPAEQPAQQTGPWSKYAPASPEQAPAAPEGEVGWLTPVDDAMRVAADSMSRGYLDKLLGDEAQQHTARSRERLSGWVETPVDIASAVVSSPYRVGSMGVGALAGAAEGAASAYGHQDDWTPDSGETMDILKNAGIGAVAGAGGAKLGEWIGGRRAASAADDAKPFQTQDELVAASDEASTKAAADYDAGVTDIPWSQQSQDLASRVSNVDEILATKGVTRDTFAKMLDGMENASPEVKAKIAEIAGKQSLTSKVGEKIPNKITEGGLDRTLLTFLTLGPKAAGVRLGAQGLKAAGKSDWANTVPDKEIEALAELARNGQLDIDPATIDRWRDAFAKSSIGYGRSP